jgi:dihydrofolate reductase
MRKLIVSSLMSLDGYVAGPPDSPIPLPADRNFNPASFDAYNLERLRAAGTLLLGRKTYDMFRGFWPPVADDANAAFTHREISRLNNAIEKLVVSDSLTPDQTEPWRETTRIVSRAAAHDHIAALKNETGADILVFGSHAVWSDFLTGGLVDELHLMIDTAIVGGGTRAFDNAPAGLLKLVETRIWDGSGNVLMRYEVRPQA